MSSDHVPAPGREPEPDRPAETPHCEQCAEPIAHGEMCVTAGVDMSTPYGRARVGAFAVYCATCYDGPLPDDADLDGPRPGS